MNGKLLNELKLKLEKEKTALEKELKAFAEKDKKLEHDWDTRFPVFGEESGSSGLEKEANEVEEYATLLPIEYALETKLKNINLALEKIKKDALKGRRPKGRTSPRAGTSPKRRDTYGKCERCKQEIEEKLLKVCPETKFCLECKKK